MGHDGELNEYGRSSRESHCCPDLSCVEREATGFDWSITEEDEDGIHRSTIEPKAEVCQDELTNSRQFQEFLHREDRPIIVRRLLRLEEGSGYTRV